MLVPPRYRPKDKEQCVAFIYLIGQDHNLHTCIFGWDRYEFIPYYTVENITNRHLVLCIGGETTVDK